MYGEAGRGRGQGRGRGRGGGRGGGGDWKSEKSRLQMAQEEDALEATLGYAAFTEGEQRLGWLMNVCAVRPVPVSLLAARARASSSTSSSSSSSSSRRVPAPPARALDLGTRRSLFKISRGSAPTPRAARASTATASSRYAPRSRRESHDRVARARRARRDPAPA